MCRSIKTLRTPTPATDDEIQAAARQFVRKVSGFREPSSKNAEAFEDAVAQVAEATDRLLSRLPASKAAPAARPSNGVRRLTTR
jgi:hypothetical protein